MKHSEVKYLSIFLIQGPYTPPTEEPGKLLKSFRVTFVKYFPARFFSIKHWTLLTLIVAVIKDSTSQYCCRESE